MPNVGRASVTPNPARSEPSSVAGATRGGGPGGLAHGGGDLRVADASIVPDDPVPGSVLTVTTVAVRVPATIAPRSGEATSHHPPVACPPRRGKGGGPAPPTGAADPPRTATIIVKRTEGDLHAARLPLDHLGRGEGALRRA